ATDGDARDAPANRCEDARGDRVREAVDGIVRVWTDPGEEHADEKDQHEDVQGRDQNVGDHRHRINDPPAGDQTATAPASPSCSRLTPQPRSPRSSPWTGSAALCPSRAALH